MKVLFRKPWRWDFFKIVVLSILVVFTITYTIPWIFSNSLDKEYSGVDFHGYWYAGHFVRQGINSFAAILNDPNPVYWNPQIPGSGDPYKEGGAESSLKLPIYYLDGPVANQHPVAQAMIVTPAVAAPLNLMMGFFSWLSWPTARLSWMILNLIFAASIPWLALRLIPKQITLSFLDKFIFALVFYNFFGLKQSVAVGQQTLISLFLLILALLFRKNWLVSGILLGFGISKYSVGLPVFLYFFMQKNYRAMAVGLFVQILAIVLLIPLKLGSPIETITAYLKIITVNYFQEGIHLSARFPAGSFLSTALMVLIWFIGVFLLIRQYRSYAILRPGEDYMGLGELNLITVAVFLTTYHRIHDMPFMVFFLLLLIPVLTEVPDIFTNKPSTVLFYVGSIIVVLILIVPSIPLKMNSLVSDNWNTAEGISSVSLILIFLMSAWLLSRTTITNLSSSKKPDLI